MGIDRDGFNGPITFCCDSCGDLDETRCAEFSGALAKVKSHGWVARKVGDDWLHYCGDCGKVPA
jgi:hypothetical protein